MTRPSWFGRAVAGLEDATERNANNPGRLFWLAPRSWRLNAAFAGANAFAAVVLAAMGQVLGAVVSLVAAVAGAAFAWLRWDRQRRLRGA